MARHHETVHRSGAQRLRKLIGLCVTLAFVVVATPGMGRGGAPGSLLFALASDPTASAQALTIVTDNGGPFRSFRFEAFIATHAELRHVRTRVRTPGQNGSRERGFGSLKYERLFLEEIPDAIDLAAHTEHYRVEYNTVRPHENLSWNRPIEVHLGYADPKTPNFPEPQNLPSP